MTAVHEGAAAPHKKIDPRDDHSTQADPQASPLQEPEAADESPRSPRSPYLDRFRDERLKKYAPRSGGPRSEEGKRRASGNSLKHGAYALEPRLLGSPVDDFTKVSSDALCGMDASGEF